MIIAVDIDSTLHDYWTQLAAVAHERFGIELPYESQHTWRIEPLRAEQVRAVVAESHSDELILAAEPYPGAVEAVNGWVEAGHEVHVASQRAASSHDATAEWLVRIGLRHSALHCCEDKLPVCTGLGVRLLIDDSPETLSRALDAGLLVATINHPWNRDLRETEDVVCAPDWPALATALAPLTAL